MGKPKTEAEIKKEAKALRDLKPKVRRFSMFGGDNHAKLAAQIDVLESRKSEDQVWEDYPTEYDDDGETELESPLRDAALEAVQWMNGETNESLATGWPTV